MLIFSAGCLEHGDAGSAHLQTPSQMPQGAHTQTGEGVGRGQRSRVGGGPGACSPRGGGPGDTVPGGEEAPQSFRKLGGLVVRAPPTPAGPVKYELGLEAWSHSGWESCFLINREVEKFSNH